MNLIVCINYNDLNSYENVVHELHNIILRYNQPIAKWGSVKPQSEVNDLAIPHV